MPPLSVKRDSNEYEPPSWPEAPLNVPVPLGRSPFHSAFAVLIAIGSSPGRVVECGWWQASPLSSS